MKYFNRFRKPLMFGLLTGVLSLTYVLVTAVGTAKARNTGESCRSGRTMQGVGGSAATNVEHCYQLLLRPQAQLPFWAATPMRHRNVLISVH